MPSYFIHAGPLLPTSDYELFQKTQLPGVSYENNLCVSKGYVEPLLGYPLQD
jgi:hypothetical protein